MRDLRLELFAHLQRLPVAYFDRTPVGRLVTRGTSDVEALNELFTSGVVAGLGDLFTLVAISVVMLVIDWRLALAAFVVIPFVFLGVSRLFQRACELPTARSARVSPRSTHSSRSASRACAWCSCSGGRPDERRDSRR